MKQLNFGSTNGVPNDPDKTVVHCPDANLVHKICGISNYIISPIHPYTNKTCVHIGFGYGTIEYYVSLGYTILPAEEFIRLNTTDQPGAAIGTPFKAGDKVFHHLYGGWGTVCSVANEAVEVVFDDNIHSYINWRELSFTEYTLQGFSQERPKPDIKKGQLIYVRDGRGVWKMRHFSHYDENGVACFNYQKKEGQCTTWPEYSLTNPLEEK